MLIRRCRCGDLCVRALRDRRRRRAQQKKKADVEEQLVVPPKRLDDPPAVEARRQDAVDAQNRRLACLRAISRRHLSPATSSSNSPRTPSREEKAPAQSRKLRGHPPRPAAAIRSTRSACSAAPMPCRRACNSTRCSPLSASIPRKSRIRSASSTRSEGGGRGEEGR